MASAARGWSIESTRFWPRGEGRTVRAFDFAGELVAGALPRRALALVAEWAALHHDELLANWERARREESLQPIAPLP